MPFVNVNNSQNDDLKDDATDQKTSDIPAFDPNIPIVGETEIKAMPKEQPVVESKVPEPAEPAKSSVTDSALNPTLSSQPQLRDDGVVITSRPFKDNEQEASDVTEPSSPATMEDSVPAKPQEASFTDEIPEPDMKQTPAELPELETAKETVETPEVPEIQAVSNAPEELGVEGLAGKMPASPVVSPQETQGTQETNISTSGGIENVEYYAKLCLEKNASDIHFTVGYPVFLRIDGRLEKYSTKSLEPEESKELLYSVLSDGQKKLVEEGHEVDFMYVDPNKNRFRVNVYREKGNLAGAFRTIPKKVRTIQDLGLPSILKEFSKIPYGLVLVTGPTGSGKSTSIAAMIEEINKTEPRHIITIEDPVEYVYDQKVALIAQRTMHEDTDSWAEALRAVLRQDPDVVLVGEMRDYETISSALTIAETGHLVFATLHTNSAAQTVDRIIDVFPADQQNQVKTQLGNMLSGVISQRLVPLRNGGRKAAMEVLIASNAVKNAIREGKTHQIDNIIQTSADIGMFTLEKSLVDMIRMNEVDIETAKNFTIKPDQIDLLLK